MSVALKSQSGMKVAGVIDAWATALMFSLTEVKYAWSVSASMVTVAGTGVPFGSITCAAAVRQTNADTSATSAKLNLGLPERREGCFMGRPCPFSGTTLSFGAPCVK